MTDSYKILCWWLK